MERLRHPWWAGGFYNFFLNPLSSAFVTHLLSSSFSSLSLLLLANFGSPAPIPHSIIASLLSFGPD